MTGKIDLSTLVSRPSWKIVKWLKLLTFFTATISVIMILLGLIAGYMYMVIPDREETPMEAFLGSASSLLENAGYYGLTICFYSVLLWLAAQVADKLDQLVWLAASEEDRQQIYNQRQKKKTK